ncbi:MAG: hypothetical protein K6E20_05985 [Acholeplasmatales bacterium]|nr:hypothetical protein [Acholeplasmatales bacterium]
MNLNIYGVIISILFIIFNIIPKAIKPKRRIKHLKHNQALNIKFISESGIIVFGLVTISGVGYHKINNVTTVIWLILFFFLIILILLLNLRYLIKRNEECLYNKFICPIPYSISYSSFIFISSILLFNPIVLGFNIAYAISYIYLDLKGRSEVFYE